MFQFACHHKEIAHCVHANNAKSNTTPAPSSSSTCEILRNPKQPRSKDFQLQIFWRKGFPPVLHTEVQEPLGDGGMLSSSVPRLELELKCSCSQDLVNTLEQLNGSHLHKWLSETHAPSCLLYHLTLTHLWNYFERKP